MALQEEFKKQGDFLFKYRSHLPLILLVIGILVKIYQVEFVNTISLSVLPKVLEISGIAFGVLGLLVRVFTVGYTPENTSGRNTKGGQIADSLNTTGIYSLIRNPLYLGNYLMWLAIAMLTGNSWFVLVFSLGFWLYYERIIYAEEAFLKNKFGEGYLNWTLKTPPFLPSHFNYVKPGIPFSWKKVMKKEKNGLFALFLLIFVFDMLGEFVGENSFNLLDSWTFYAAVASGIIYFILKYLKKSHKLDEEGR